MCKYTYIHYTQQLTTWCWSRREEAVHFLGYSQDPTERQTDPSQPNPIAKSAWTCVFLLRQFFPILSSYKRKEKTMRMGNTFICFCCTFFFFLFFFWFYFVPFFFFFFFFFFLLFGFFFFFFVRFFCSVFFCSVFFWFGFFWFGFFLVRFFLGSVFFFFFFFSSSPQD